MGLKIKGITVSVGGDTSPLAKALDGVTKQAKSIQSELTKVNKLLKVDPKNTELLAQKQELLTKAISSTKDKLDILRQAQEKVNKAHEANAQWEKEYTPLKAEIDETRNKLKNLTVQQEEMNTKFANGKISTEEYNKFQTALEQTTQKSKDLAKQQKELEAQFKDGHISDEQYRDFQRELVTTEQQLKSLQYQAEQSSSKLLAIGTALNTVGSKLKSTGDNIANVGTSLTAKISAPILAIGTAAAKVSMDFEDGLAKISTIADTSQISLKDLGNGVIALSNQTGASVGDLNEALYQAISSGVKTGDTLEFMNTATKTAIGGFSDTETVVDGLTTVLNAYGMSAKDVSKISNQMIVTQNLGKTTVNELAQTIGNAIPTFATANIGTKEFFSSLAVLTANGIKTSEAVTGMKAALSNIIKPTKEASDAADSMGLKFNSAELASKGWMPFLQEVKAKLKDVAPEYAASADKVSNLTAKITAMTKSGSKNTDQLKSLKSQLKAAQGNMDALEKSSSGQLSAFATMFGSVEGLNSVLTLTSEQGVSLYNESMKEMGSNTDYVNDAFEKIHNTTGNKLKNSFNELKNAGIKFGDAVAPVISKFSDTIMSLAKAFENMNDAQKETLVKQLAIVAAAPPLLGVFGKVTSGLGSIFTVTGKAITGVKDFTIGLKGVAPVAGEVVSGATKVGGALASMGGAPVLAALAAVTLAIGAIVIAAKNQRTAIDDTIDSIKNETKSFQDLKQTQSESMSANLAQIDNVKSLWNELQKLIDANGNIKKGYEARVQFIVSQLNPVLGDTVKMNGNEKVSINNTADAINKLIEKQRMQIQLDADKEIYSKALANLKEAENKQTELAITLQDAKNKVEQDNIELAKAEKAQNQQAVIDAQKKWGVDQELLEKTQIAYDSNRANMKTYHEAVDGYERASGLVLAGEYSKAQAILDQYGVKQKESTNTQREQLAQQALDANVKLAEVRREYAEHWAGVTADTVSGAEQAALQANNAFLSVGGQAGQGIILGLDSQNQLIYKTGEDTGYAVVGGALSVDYEHYGTQGAVRLRNGANNVNFSSSGYSKGSDFGNSFVNGAVSAWNNGERFNLATGKTEYQFWKALQTPGSSTWSPSQVKWHANGGVFDKPTIIGIGEGEDKEAALPLNKKTYTEIAIGILKNIPSINQPIAVNPQSKSSQPTVIQNDTSRSINLSIENFINNRQQDVRALGEELEFYTRQKTKAIGG